MPPDFSTMMQQFGAGITQAYGGDWGNAFPGYRDMRSQIANTQVKEAEARDLSAHAEHQRMVDQSAKQQAQVMQRLAQQKTQQQATLSGQQQRFLDLSEALFEKGEFQGSTKALDAAREIESTRATARHQDLLSEKLQSDAVQDKADTFEQLASGVTNQMEQEAARVAWGQRFPVGQNPFSGIYNKEELDGLRSTTKAGMERSKSASTQKELEEKLKHFQALDERLRNRTKYDNRMLDLRAKEDERRAKGGSPVKYGGADLQGHAEDAIKKQFPNLSDDDRKTFGWEIAQRVEGLVASTRMDRGSALQQALGERRSEIEELDKDRKEHGGLMGWVHDIMSKFSSSKDGPKVPPINSKGWRLMTDKDGNQAYVSSDGKEFEELGDPGAGDDEVIDEEPAENWAAQQGR